MKKFLLSALLFYAVNIYSQVSIHQEENEHYRQLGFSAEDYENINSPLPVTRADRGGCQLNKIVYGWHPYWSNGLQSNYDWSLLTHLSYFSYEVDANTGNALSTHSFSTTQSVTDALSNGVRVDLCVTLFSNHAILLGNATSRQTLITNLINLISARGAHGVNIDFEGIPSSQTANFTSFMNDLAGQMHAAIPGSQVSTVLYAVDWNNVFDVANMPAVDYFIIMGYDYYWTGSTTAGPNDPLFHFGTSYNYTLSKSVSYYLDKGVPENKLILGLPYYGREWSVSSSAIPSPATSSGTSRTFTYVKTNTSGNYSSANRSFDDESYSAYYTFNNGGLKQCFITEKYEMGERLDFISKRGIAGMGIWALGYDDGYTDFWEEISEHFTNCYSDPCTDSLFDIGGGPDKNYYNDEDYTYTISPPNAQTITVNFSSFSVENNYDYLYIYDGPSTTAPQIAGSPFTGTNSPGIFTSSGNSLTFRFTSDVSTVSTGWNATYTCNQDEVAPVTTISSGNGWKTADFPVSFTDNDNTGGSGVDKKFWQVLDNNGTEWRAQASEGFFNDNFQNTLHADWTTVTGNWSIASQHLLMSDETQQNSNLYTPLTQNANYSYLYHWQAVMSGTGTNRRSGIHFFCDDPTLTNRGNSYFVYFRIDSDKCQIYKVVNDVFTLMTDDDVILNASSWYDYKITYDPLSGKIKAYVDDVLVSEWTDPSPLLNGNSVSLRSGGTIAEYDDVKVYRSRGNTENISLGNSSSMVRYQNNGTSAPSCRIKSIVNDNSANWSAPASQDENIDWTAPVPVSVLNDGAAADIDSVTSNNNTGINWTTSSDSHSGIFFYEVSVGATPGDSSVSGWLNAGNNSSFIFSSVFLNYGQTYYSNVRAVNNAGLKSVVTSSDGFYVMPSTGAPTAMFSNNAIHLCAGDTLEFDNSSVNATGFNWSFQGGSPPASTLAEPGVYYSSSGNYSVTLIANGPGGTDTLTQQIAVTVHSSPLASFSVNDTVLYLPNAFAGITNNSLNSTQWLWDFGNGNGSADEDPWITYDSAGSYTITLVAINEGCEGDTATVNITVLGPAGIFPEDQEEIRIWPNPFDDFIRIRISSAIPEIYLTDITGKIISEKRRDNYPGDLSFDTGQLAPGIYFLVINDGTSPHFFKLVKHNRK